MRTDHPEDFKTPEPASVDYEQLALDKQESDDYEKEQAAKIVGTKHRCDNCQSIITTIEAESGYLKIQNIEGGEPDAIFTEEWHVGDTFDDLSTVPNLGARLTPGSVVPSGDCPACGAFCYLMPEPIAPENLFVCAECGGTSIQCLDWVDSNTNEFIGDNCGGGDGDFYCNDCEDHTRQILKSDYDEVVR